MEKLPERKHPRLKGFDYSHGWYFVTICTAERKKCLGQVCVGRGALTPPFAPIAPQTELSEIGQVVKKHILRTDTIYPSVQISKFVIMPNHIHMIIAIDVADGGVRAPRPTELSSVVRSIKAMVTREVGRSIWQSSYYDHVIRNEPDHLRVWQYIDENPAKWAEDEYFTQ